jgi:hypothetical protein
MAQFPTSSNYAHSTNLKSDASNERSYRQFPSDTPIWHNLKYAISASSGFQRWQLECNAQLQSLRLDQQVQMYLRETLETLAY